MHTPAVLLASILLAQAAEPPAKRPPAPAVVTPGVARMDPALEADVELLRKLDKPYPAGAGPKFTDAPAKDVVEAIRKETKLQIDIDRRVVGDSGGWEWQRVTCEPASPRAALDAVVRAISPAYDAYKVDVAAGVVVFTDDAGRRTLRASAPYELGTLASRANELGETDADADAARGGAIATILDAIRAVDADSWSENGGEVGRVASVTGTVAVIETSPAVHHAIRRRLAEISGALPPSTVLWAIEFLEVPAGASDKAIAAALGSDAETPELDAGWERLAAPRLLAQRSEPASVTIGSDADGAQEALSASIERLAGTAPDAYLVRVSDTRGAQQRSLELRAVVGMPAAAFIGDAARGGLVVRVRGNAVPDAKPAANGAAAAEKARTAAPTGATK
jgi:hypothetical protein